MANDVQADRDARARQSLDEVAAAKLEALERRTLRRRLTITERASATHADQDGRELESFSCNDYLGLSQHPDVIAASVDATRRYGVGAGSSRRVNGKLKIRSATTRERFIESVNRAKEYIAAGDIFQVVLSLRLDFTPGVEPFDIYRALRTVNPSPYMYFLRMGATHILGSSPEMLVRATGRKLEYRPIAGTHPRGRDEAEDARLEKAMLEDEKERAEHVMLVDLGRNDIGRVSEYGSVRVRDLMFVERYSHVMHIVSALEGKLRSDMDAIDAFAACFPAGTLSGAPKVRAMQIIEQLEPTRRAIYGGSVLYADFAGNLDSCIAIRTLLMEGKRGYLQAGAGIVADSDPVREYEECMSKAKAVLRAVETARGGEQ